MQRLFIIPKVIAMAAAAGLRDIDFATVAAKALECEVDDLRVSTIILPSCGTEAFAYQRIGTEDVPGLVYK